MVRGHTTVKVWALLHNEVLFYQDVLGAQKAFVKRTVYLEFGDRSVIGNSLVGLTLGLRKLELASMCVLRYFRSFILTEKKKENLWTVGMENGACKQLW